MRHLVAGKKLNRNTSHRISLIRNMTISLVQHEQIVTTLPKAKFLRPFAEKIITIGIEYAKSVDEARKLFLRRLILARLGGKSHNAVEKILTILSERYKNRNGGYTRILKYKHRIDSTQTAVIEFVDRDVEAKGKSFIKK
jgi:large subunit ribosomal protein L17